VGKFNLYKDILRIIDLVEVSCLEKYYELLQTETDMSLNPDGSINKDKIIVRSTWDGRDVRMRNL
jgi:hypothetical protein